MNVYVYVASGPLGSAIRQCIEKVLGSPATNLGDLPAARWKETIAEADAIIADVTGQNAAASYLVGLAEALAKRIILLAPIAESIPPVFADRMVIVHQWNFEYLRTELQKLTGQAAATRAPSAFDDSPSGKFHQHFGDLLQSHSYVHRGSVEFDGSTFTLREQEMDLPLVQAIANRAKSLNLRVRLL